MSIFNSQRSQTHTHSSLHSVIMSDDLQQQHVEYHNPCDVQNDDDEDCRTTIVDNEETNQNIITEQLDFSDYDETQPLYQPSPLSDVVAPCDSPKLRTNDKNKKRIYEEVDERTRAGSWSDDDDDDKDDLSYDSGSATMLVKPRKVFKFIDPDGVRCPCCMHAVVE